MATLPGFSLARRLAAGETVYTGWCALPAPIVAETIAREGFNTVTIAKAFVSATKYPPLGERSWGPTRAMTVAGIGDMKAYLREANENTVTLAMIETKT